MSPKNILVTGGCGFIGSNFINHMLQSYNDIFIVNIDKLDYCADVNNILNKDPNRYQLIITDINNTNVILNTLKVYNIDTVVHFAAQSHVDNSFKNSLQFTFDNVLGTHSLLEASREYGKLSKFVHCSTDECYGEVDLEHDGCTEKSLLNPTNPYAATKAAAEFLVRSYYHSYKLPILITRGNNTYGLFQYPEKLIPKFIEHFLKNEKCTIHGEGKTRRNFIFAEDTAKAFDFIVRKGVINEIYNIGSKNEYSVMDIFNILHKKLNIQKDKEDCLVYVEDRNFNDFRYAVNCEKLKELGWKEETTFEEGLDKTIEWYKSKLNL